MLDDEPTLRLIVGTILEELGYRVTEAGDGPHAIAILQADPSICLLVTDMNLPGGVNGRDVARSARATRPDIAVLFMSADGDAVDRNQLSSRMGMLVKPFSMDRLTSAIQALAA